MEFAGGRGTSMHRVLNLFRGVSMALFLYADVQLADWALRARSWIHWKGAAEFSLPEDLNHGRFGHIGTQPAYLLHDLAIGSAQRVYFIYQPKEHAPGGTAWP
jgi:hypothetical protein